MDKKKLQYNMKDWTFTCRKVYIFANSSSFPFIFQDIPTQKNSSDCGMFACLFAENASRHARITFDQKHISYFRQRMAFEIYQKELL
jgi:sentrin-specific protease 1